MGTCRNGTDLTERKMEGLHHRRITTEVPQWAPNVDDDEATLPIRLGGSR